MQYIDEKFKDSDPKATVAKIQGILESIGLPVYEKWSDSGMENCQSLNVYAENGTVSSNGKGITKEFARASAYGELIERLQSGLFIYKYQSIRRQPGMNLHAFAPDAKYMTVAELVENGDWMDHLIAEYKDPMITRELIAEHCKAYDLGDDDRVLTVPYYSLFEKKHVYLPVGFVEQMYSSNGCCAGNTREEAWVHALAEVMERHCTLRILESGSAVPKIPEETLQKFPTVSKILAKIRENDDVVVDVFDYSMGTGFPVISTRIISKEDHSYRVNVAADPVLEIAIQRTLTEMFQGNSLKTVTKKHSGRILNKMSDISISSNEINQLENGTGFFAADYFANELCCDKACADFPDNSQKSNKELLDYMLELYRKLGKQIYVRNLSYLGFASYKFVVPGFSESKAFWLSDPIPEYAIADEAAKTLRNVAGATDEELNWMLLYHKVISDRFGRYMAFNRVSGIPLALENNVLLACISRAYAAYRLKRYTEAKGYLSSYLKSNGIGQEEKTYFACVNKYLEMKAAKIEDKKIFVILYKFFHAKECDRLYRNLQQGGTPFDEFLVSCDFQNCENCRYHDSCSFAGIRRLIGKMGSVYQNYTEGQAPSEFAI